MTASLEFGVGSRQIRALLVSSLAYRELGSHHFFPHNMKKAEQTKNQLFLNPSENWNHRGADPKTGETGEYAESRVTRSRNCHWRQQLVGQFKEYMANCWRLTLDWLERKIPGGAVLHPDILPGCRLEVKIREKSPYASSREGGKSNHF